MNIALYGMIKMCSLQEYIFSVKQILEDLELQKHEEKAHEEYLFRIGGINVRV